jgi:anti-sigma regulatory factor (Ser/Thr protein kinase)
MSEADEVLVEFNVTSEEGNERVAIDRVVDAVDGLALPTKTLERLKTAVGETVMNAIEHGNKYREDLEVAVVVSASPERIAVKVTDHGGDRPIPTAETPDIEAKLVGDQSPRGWGLFLVGQMVDDLKSTSHDGLHTVELVMNREGAR